MCIHAHACVCSCMCVSMRVWAYVCVYFCVFVCAYFHICRYMCDCVCTFVHVQVHVCVHIHGNHHEPQGSLIFLHFEQGVGSFTWTKGFLIKLVQLASLFRGSPDFFFFITHAGIVGICPCRPKIYAYTRYSNPGYHSSIASTFKIQL